MARLKLGVLISGRGSNLQALIDATEDARFPAEIVLVISNDAGATGLARAATANIPTLVLPHRGYASRAAYDAVLTEALEKANVHLVCLAGFMRLLSPDFVRHWHNQLINIHPSLLPDFKGLDTHRRVLEAGVAETGCTVHFVRAEMDAGPIIVQARVPVLPGDDEPTLAARVLQAEHLAYVSAVKAFAEGRVTINNEAVEIAAE